jgi:hypothetical protein
VVLLLAVLVVGAESAGGGGEAGMSGDTAVGVVCRVKEVWGCI